jgi:hypothetical protein
MGDYNELKRLAEALVSALNEYNSDDCSKHRLDAWSAADDALQNAAGPEVILALIAENERLKKFEDWFVRLETANNSLAESFRAERDQIKAENEALRRQIPSAEIVWCACGDGHAANSYGAGFMDANGGVCANCDAANQGVEPDLDAMRKDAERYRWLRSRHWNESDMAVACHPKKSVKLGFDCPSGERLDHAIDAAMGKGEQA